MGSRKGDSTGKEKGAREGRTPRTRRRSRKSEGPTLPHEKSQIVENEG